MKKQIGISFSPIQIFESPVWAGIAAFLIYALVATRSGPIWQNSGAAYFNYLADAFLHGQSYLRVTPSLTLDLAINNGNYYLYWPPFPAVLLMPFVALFGINFSDVLFTLALAGLNVGLVAYFLRLLSDKEIAPTQPWQRFLLVILFSFGSVHFILARWGIAWFTSQIVAFLCGLLIYIIVLRYKGTKAFFFSGLFLSLAMMSRSHLIFLGIWPAYYLFKKHRELGYKKLIGAYAVFVTPILVALIVYAGYNWERFGSFFDLGIGTSYRNLGPFLQGDFEKYGHFSIHYIPTNIYYNFIFYPFPLSNETLMGGSLFLLSPVYIAAFWGFKSSQPKASNWVLGITILAVLIPILVNIGTGWATFGPRYTLDFTPPLLMLTAVGISRFHRRLLVILTAISVTHYLIGALMVLFY